MTLFYCMTCHTVAAFNVYDIKKHGLQPIEQRECHVCRNKFCYQPVEEKEP